MSVSFGIQGAGQYPEGMPDGSFFRDVAQQAEELGYDSLWAGEHISFENPVLEGFVALSFFAGCTTRIQLGTGVILMSLRHPTLIAKQVASLDHLAQGRFVFGVGVGGEGDKDFAAVEVPKKERGSRTDEGLDVVRTLWAGPHASFSGGHYSVEDVTIDPPPLQAGGPPIWIGGRSPRALRRVAQKGDGWLAAFSSPESFAKGLKILEEEVRAAGRSADSIAKAHYVHTVVNPDNQKARDQAHEHFNARYGRQVDDHVIDRYCLVGDAESCVLRVREYIEAGVEHLVFVPMVSPDDFQLQMSEISAGVIDSYRQAYPQ